MHLFLNTKNWDFCYKVLISSHVTTGEVSKSPNPKDRI